VISYAQNYEDVILARVFPGKTDGFYIDIGAADPIEHSVTKHFSDLGWRGINIEPIRSYWEKLTAERPRDVNLQVAVGERHETRTFYNISNQYLSTLDPATAALGVEAGGVLTEEPIELWTLAEICQRHAADTPIDILKIDVERWEEQVIRGGDWVRFRPRVVVVEATEPNSPTPRFENWEPMFLAAGYLFVYFDGLNRFYLRSEDSALKVCFATPPNVFDRYRQHREIDLEQKAIRWYAEKSEANDRLAQVTLTRDVLAAEVASLTQAHESANRHADKLIQERDAALAREQEALAAHAVTQDILAATALQKGKLENRQIHLEHEHNRRQHELRHLHRTLEALRVERDQLSIQASQIQQSIDALQASRYWRYTRALRRCGRLLKRLRAKVRRFGRPLAATAPALIAAPTSEPLPARQPLLKRGVKKCLRAVGGRYFAHYLQKKIDRQMSERIAPIQALHHQVAERLRILEATLAQHDQRRQLIEMCIDALVRRDVGEAEDVATEGGVRIQRSAA
jgi:FkbM family methyltransferase